MPAVPPQLSRLNGASTSIVALSGDTRLGLLRDEHGSGNGSGTMTGELDSPPFTACGVAWIRLIRQCCFRHSLSVISGRSDYHNSIENVHESVS